MTIPLKPGYVVSPRHPFLSDLVVCAFGRLSYQDSLPLPIPQPARRGDTLGRATSLLSSLFIEEPRGTAQNHTQPSIHQYDPRDPPIPSAS
jgi:hypothetical protein